jgi:Ca2+-binding RTX toxin-like protein
VIDANGVVLDLWISPSSEDSVCGDANGCDGDDYIEGGGGADTIFGGLGQDDIVGGSSSLFTLTTSVMRPDGDDLVFGGAGKQAARSQDTANSHSLDADTIVADNGNIWRLVGTKTGTTTTVTPTFLAFAYDNYPGRKIVVRATELLDYLPGGPDFQPASYTPSAGYCRTDGFGQGSATFDRGGNNEVHGESGDDTVYGGCGSDRLFGDSDDDDLIGGWGHDWISGGTGQDGILGDDGRIFTSRNGTAEPLYGIAATTQQNISSPGNAQSATIYPTGQLNKSVDLTPFDLTPNSAGADNPLFDPLYADDVIFGGLGDDFLHGGAGDDAISGAEALATGYAANMVNGTLTEVVRSDFARPYNPGDLLHFGDGTRGSEFALYDEFHPLQKVMVNGGEFFLNFSNTEGPILTGTTVQSDGRDVIFGDLGNDWLVGGTGRDDLWGGWGNDLLQADDVLTTNSGANSSPDTNTVYEDRAFGGAGLDILIGNTGGDRLIDWTGEFNSYIVPFSPFGLGTVSRQISPGLTEFLYALSKADGADPTRATDTGAEAIRNGEPAGELGLIVQKDPAWQDQTGGPIDPQGPVGHSGPKDVRRSADFNDGNMQAFAPDSGTWTVSGGALQVSSTSPTTDAVAVYYHDTYLPTYYEIAAQILAVKPTGGWNANAYIIFDYFSPTNFKFAGINISTDKYEMGYRDATGWHVVRQTNVQIKPDEYYNMLVAVNGTAVSVSVNGQAAFEYVFPAQIVDGQPVPLNKGLIGMGSQGARGTFDNIAVQVLAAQMTFDETETFTDGIADRFTLPEGAWSTSAGRLATTPAPGLTNVDLMDFGKRINVNNFLELTTRLSTTGTAGIVFDRYATGDYKFVALDVPGQRIVIGHSAPGAGWVIESSIARTLVAGQDYDLQLILRGASISVVLNGAFVISWGFNSAVVDGLFGLIARDGSASFDTVQVRTNDEAFGVSTPPPPPTTPSVSIGDGSVVEGAAGTSKQVTLTLTLSQAPTLPVSVAWTTQAATAMAGTDYVHATGTVTFAEGQTSATITVTVLGDNSVEGLEGFNVLLSNPQGVTISDGTANVAINDDDAPPPLPSVSISNASTTEGAGGTTKTVTLTLSLSLAAAGPTTVAWATAPGSATAGSDYTSASGTVTFAAGQTSATVTIIVVGDNTVEGNETFSVNLSNPQGMLIGSGTGIVTITDDDVAPPPQLTISIGDALATEGDKNTTVTVTLTLSAAGTSAVSVTATTVARTATAGSDYTHKAAVVTFAAGQTSATFTVTITGDRKGELSEYFEIALSAPTGGATIADGLGRVTITDNDARLLATSAGPGTGAGAGATPITVEAAQPALAAATAAWVAAGASASALAGITIRLEALDGLQLGYVDGRVIVLDTDAAGWGWHSNPGVPVPADRIDLLTVLAHELGHHLGLEHAATGVMKDELAPGERLLPAKRAAAPAPSASAILAMSFAQAVANWWKSVTARQAATPVKKSKSAKRCSKRARKGAAKAKRGKRARRAGSRAKCRSAKRPRRG